MEFSGFLTPPEFWDFLNDEEETVRHGAAAHPPLGVAGWSGPVMLSEWAHFIGARSLLHGKHEGNGPRVLVRVGDESPRDGVRILKWYDGEPSADNPQPSLTDPLVPDHIAEIEVDGTPVLFEVWRGIGVTWAGGWWRRESVVVEARGVTLDEIRLTTIADIEPYLAGWRRSIAAQRGEDPTQH